HHQLPCATGTRRQGSRGMTADTIRHRPASPRTIVGRTLSYAALSVLALVVIFPLAWMLLTSFKTDADAVRNPYGLPNPFSFEAYERLLVSGQQPIFLWLWNSFAAATLQTLLILVTASMAAYALARLDF